MHLTMATCYAVRALLCLAKNSETSVSVTDMCEEIKASENYMRMVITKLRKAGYLTTTSGVHGGCSLIVAPNTITLNDVVTIIEGTIRMRPVDTLVDQVGDSVEIALDGLQEVVSGYLTHITIADLMTASDLTQKIAPYRNSERITSQ